MSGRSDLDQRLPVRGKPIASISIKASRIAIMVWDPRLRRASKMRLATSSVSPTPDSSRFSGSLMFARFVPESIIKY